jgi:hypothetical protein
MGLTTCQRRHYAVQGQGFSTNTFTSVDVDTTVGGTAIPTTAATDRAYVYFVVAESFAGTLYLRIDGNAPTTSNYQFALKGGDTFGWWLPDTEAMKGITDAGTATVKLTESKTDV